MTQILDRLPANVDRILCCYSNHDRNIKIARITNISNWYFERVVFPRERLLFEALPEARLEIYVTNFATVALVEIIVCDRLTVKIPQLGQKWIDQQRENFVDELDQSFKIAEKFMNKQSFPSSLIQE